MYHSVIFGNKNTYSDWHLVPDSRPVIAMPNAKTVTVDIPGTSGVLDLSESLTGYPLYENRTGSIDFHVLNDYEEWQVLYERIANYLNGKRMRMILEDDPLYYYMGRYSISWTSNNNGTWSDVSIDYDVEPYKLFNKTSAEENASLYNNIVVNNAAITKTLTNTGTIGKMPVIPTFIVSNIGSSGLTVALTNNELGISNLTKTINTNGSYKFYDMILSAINDSNACSLTFNGKGTVKVSFTKGTL